MWRALRFFAVVGVLVAGVLWISDRPGRVGIAWLGWRVDTSAALLIAAVVVVATAWAILYAIWRAVRRAPGEFVVARQARKRARGYKALTQGLVAVAAGDPDEAKRQAKRADVLLNEPPLTLLLSAQAAQLGGDEEAAKRFFTVMLDNAETAFLGVRGLLRQAMNAGDRAEALRLAERAKELRPDTPWVQTTLFELQAKSGQWDAAEETLRAVARAKLMDEAILRRRRAAVLVERARLAQQQGDLDGALSLSRQAQRADPGSVPAAAAAVRRLAEAGRMGKAKRLALAAWETVPHPDIAAAYLRAFPQAEALEKLRQLERLAQRNPEHEESRLVLGAAALEARLWGEARRHLAAAAGDGEPSARACRLMAEVERGETGDLGAMQAWLDRAALAPEAPRWVCSDCGAVAASWAGLCGHCGAFDRLAWQAPRRVGAIAPEIKPRGAIAPLAANDAAAEPSDARDLEIPALAAAEAPPKPVS